MSSYVIEQDPKLKAMLTLDGNKFLNEYKKNRQTNQLLNGVVVGVLMGFSESYQPLVVFPGNQNEVGIKAYSTTLFDNKDIGCQVALLFESGDAQKPIIIGRMQNPQDVTLTEKEPISAELDNEILELNAKKEIILRCGNSSITLTKAGKIILRGKYLLSRSSGVNRIKGGSVQIN